MSSIADVVIVGGGIAGLSTAYYLQEQARSAGRSLVCRLLESGPRLGGKLLTENVDGFVIEGGSDSFISQKPWATELCRKLGLGDQIMGTNDERRKVFVLNRGRLTPLPDGVMLIVPTRITPFLLSPLISWPGKMRMGMDYFIPRRRDPSDETVASFVRRRLGQEALDKIAEPLMGGIHVSDPERQSLLGTFPRFRDLEAKHGSLIRGMLAARKQGHGKAQSQGQPLGQAPKRSSLFLTLRGGQRQLITALEKALTETEVRRNAPVTGIERLVSGDYLVRTPAGDVQTRALVLATPANVSASLVAPLSPELGAALGSVRYVSTATVSLGFRSSDMARPLDGFGFVIPKRERRRITACTWTSTKFDHRAPEDRALLRAFVGGPGQEHLVDLGDDEMVAMVREELADIMGLKAEPVLARVYRWRKANPQYDLGHLDRVREMHRLCEHAPGLFLTGGSYEGVGVPDCVRQGQQAAAKTSEYLAQAIPEGVPLAQLEQH